jgi:hypothetical protein
MNPEMLSSLYSALKRYSDRESSEYQGWKSFFRKMPLPLIFVRAILAGAEDGIQAAKERVQ